MDILANCVSEEEMITLKEDLKPLWEDGDLICPTNGCHSQGYTPCVGNIGQRYKKDGHNVYL